MTARKSGEHTSTRTPAKSKPVAPTAPASPRALTFEERYPEILMWIEKRRRGIDLATIDWPDIRQTILIRISQQYHVYNPAQSEFSHWVNTVITNTIRNIWRDHLAGFSRPCITGKGGCVENMGNNLCRRTPSGLQCSECPAYAEWEKRKGNHHAIRLPLPLDNHSQEVHSAPSDFIDINSREKLIHQKMRDRLTRTEWRVYRAIVINHKSEQEVAVELGFRRRRKGDKARMYHGYSVILAMKKKFVACARQIIDDYDLAA